MSATKIPAELKQIVDAWCADVVNNHVNRASEACAEQATAALHALAEQAPSADGAIDIDAWFAQHFQKPPASRDTDFYNALFEAKQALKAQLAG
jgi:hypothetical protein